MTRLIPFTRLALPLAALATVAALAGCSDNFTATSSGTVPVSPTTPTPTPTPTTPTAVTPDTYALTAAGKLVGFRAADPANTATANTINTSLTLQVPAGETLLGIDFRPVDGKLYALSKVTSGNAGKVYTVNLATGALETPVTLTRSTDGSAITLAGGKYSVDFNPIPDRLRVVGDDGSNLRVNVTAATSNTIVDAVVSTGLSEAAYTNSFTSGCQTDLYYINATQLFLSANPNGVTGNAATPRLVGSLGVTADASSGFDVRTTASGNTLAAVLKVGGTPGYYEIDATTGAATAKGAVNLLGSADVVVGVAATLPVTGTTPALAAGNLIAVLDSGNVVTFNRPPAGAANKLCSTAALSGITSGETIVGGDVRPVDGKLYVLTKSGTVGKLYTVAASGAATAVATLNDGASTPANIALTGTNFGVDFNPVPDRLRVIGDDGQNLRIVPATGVTTTDTALTTNGTTTSRTGITGAGYTNSLAGGNASTLFTTLFALDIGTTADKLVRIGNDPANATAGDAGNPNSGKVNDVNALVLDSGAAATVAQDISAPTSFEINGINGAAVFTGVVGSNAFSTLWVLNLASGVYTGGGNFGGKVLALGTNTAAPVTTTVFGVTTSNKLVSFAATTPNTVMAINTISGLASGENVLGIDFRPTVGPVKANQLVALGSSGKLYVVDTATAAATALSTLGGATIVAGNEHGVDFNPLPDRLRVVSTAQQNLRINVDSGAVTTDGTLNTANVFGAGYTNSFATAGSTALYYLVDTNGANSQLATTTDPNAGALTTVGTDLGADFSNIGDLDFAGGRNGFALAALQPSTGGVSGLYRIDTAAGTATKVATGTAGDILTAGSEALRGIAIQLK